ncbi:hypothetical protein LEN26_006742 [Aphanomyces euteiches]|nr:hypothetical protein AeMF1_021620 [Aphanomyces euteiches]KAH9134645.1 hypothetical protein LEN26_006742 [Aphanomyces euteiches]KAH9191975.1 hypothetical protein AeNC1_006060 [Aphanomyces euteiches]
MRAYYEDEIVFTTTKPYTKQTALRLCSGPRQEMNLTVDISADKYDKHLEQLNVILAASLADFGHWMNSRGKPGWRLLQDKAVWKLFVGHGSNAVGQKYLCSGNLKIELPDLRDAMHCERNFHLRALGALLYGDNFVDAAILHSREIGQPASPIQFFGVKSLTLRLPSTSPDSRKTSEHTFIYLEYSGTHVDDRGCETYFVLTEPVDIGTTVSNRIGEKLSNVKLYQTNPDGGVDFTVRCHILRAGMAAAKQETIFWKDMNVSVPKLLTKDFLHLGKEETIYQAVVLATGSFAEFWDNESKTCSICSKGGLFVRQHHCRRCGYIMCRACTVKLHCVDRPSKKPTNKSIILEKFCKRCFVGAKGLSARVRSAVFSSGSRTPMSQLTTPSQVYVYGLTPTSQVGCVTPTYSDRYPSESSCLWMDADAVSKSRSAQDVEELMQKLEKSIILGLDSKS